MSVGVSNKFLARPHTFFLSSPRKGMLKCMRNRLCVTFHWFGNWAITDWPALQKSGYPGCRLARGMLVLIGIFLVLEIIRQPERQLPSSSYNHNTLITLRTSVKESLQMHFKVAVRNFHASR